MSGWLARGTYEPWLVLLVGITTFVALVGVGSGALRLGRVSLPSPWCEAVAAILGVEIESLAVQLAAFAGSATPPVLIAIWGATVLVGVASLAWWGSRNRSSLGRTMVSRSNRDKRRAPSAKRLTVVVAGMALLVDLFIAAAPSTKMDEIYYHMLLPARIVADGALRFYRYPWEAAAWPQMIFEIAAAPLHALHIPDAANAVSWCMLALLAWFAWVLLTDSGRRAETPALGAPAMGTPAFWIGALAVGTYSAVWQVTGGAHAMGDLAVACGVVAVLVPGALRDGPVAHEVLALSVFALGAASTKVSLLPFALAVLVVGALRAVRARGRGGSTWVALVGPWLLFAAPIIAYTFVRSGAPYGPFYSWLFPGTRYDAAEIQAVLQFSRTEGRHQLGVFPLELIAGHSPILWIAALASLVATTLAPRARAIAAGFLFCQLLLIALFLPYEARFLSGIPDGLLLACALCPRASLRAFLARKTVVGWATMLLLVPWLAAQVAYSIPFLAVSIGARSPEDFRRRYVMAYADYAALETLLPPSAVLLAVGRTSAVYSPRPVVFSAADLPDAAPVYSFGTSCEVRAPGLVAREVVYDDAHALVVAYRSPLRQPVYGDLCIRRLVRVASASAAARQ